MTWIKVIGFNEAKGKLLKLYQRVAGPDNNVDNILMSHSLRPHTLEGHMALYKNVLHHNANQLEKHWLEAIGVYVSLLNQCEYCVEHHYQGYARLINDNERAQKVRQAMERGQLSQVFQANEITLFEYAKKLTLTPTQLTENDINIMREAGYDDGCILEINQVAAYFNYANRTVLGLGVATAGDILGLSPNDNDDPDNWGHA
ncbi:carboxymuconolactone decarboxylase family protein [Aliikangiella sp. IMCC44359]|uniref:carboxymuconolactone decarboxylase family protein n=1 Tax=Aliikangiella sp. IMCC44359 TaxID=3459125 RepID=UPI00403AAAFD